MRVLIGVPCPYEIRSKWWSNIERWRDESTCQTRIFPEPTPNRMDWSISLILREAQKEGATWLVRLDADVKPEMPLDECLGLAEENWVKLNAVTGVPTIVNAGYDVGKVQCRPIVRIDPNRPFECHWVSGSLNFIPNQVFRRFKPLGYFQSQTGEKMPYLIPPQNTGSTEDSDFCSEVRKRGFKVFADPRILAGHRRGEDLYIPSFRKGMTDGGQVEVMLTR